MASSKNRHDYIKKSRDPLTICQTLSMPSVLSCGQASTSVSQFSLFELFLLEELQHIKCTRDQQVEHIVQQQKHSSVILDSQDPCYC